MAGQLPPDVALEAFRRAYSEAMDMNVLLRARIGVLEQENDGLRGELDVATAPSGASPAE